MSREAFVLLRCGIAEFVNAAKQIPETDEIYRIYGDVDWLIHTTLRQFWSCSGGETCTTSRFWSACMGIRFCRSS
jgi:hypothetical protein